MSTFLLLIAFFACLAASAYCSSAETAYFSVDPLQIRRIAEAHPATGNRLQQLLAKPTRLLSTILIGNTIVNIILSNIGYLLAIRWNPVYGEMIAVPVVTMLLILFGEMGPKQFGLRHTTLLIRAYAGSLLTLVRIFAPAQRGLDMLSRRFARYFRPKGRTLSEEEFETVLDISNEEGILNAEELAMIKAIVNLEDMHASDVMTPRVDFVGIDLDDPEQDPVEIARKARLNYLLLYRTHYDHAAGFLDVRKFLLDPERRLEAATFPAIYLPESIPLNRLLTRFQKDKLRVAIVVDEYGGVAGLVTRGDVLEEITGEIYNELSKPRPIFQSAGPHAWLVDANISLEEINRKLLTDLMAETSDRLAGWVTEKLGAMPQPGDVVEADGVRVRVMQTVRLRVTLAHVEMLDKRDKKPLEEEAMPYV